MTSLIDRIRDGDPADLDTNDDFFRLVVGWQKVYGDTESYWVDKNGAYVGDSPPTILLDLQLLDEAVTAEGWRWDFGHRGKNAFVTLLASTCCPTMDHLDKRRALAMAFCKAKGVE